MMFTVANNALCGNNENTWKMSRFFAVFFYNVFVFSGIFDLCILSRVECVAINFFENLFVLIILVIGKVCKYCVRGA